MPALTPEIINMAVSTTRGIQALGSPKAQTEALRRVIKVCDVFFGVVPDENGGHTILIKGRELLREISASNQAREVIQGAIVVTCDEEALAMRLVLGDGEDPEHKLH